jgi:hypothetical protein
MGSQRTAEPRSVEIKSPVEAKTVTASDRHIVCHAIAYTANVQMAGQCGQLEAIAHADCPACDGEGAIWNNADPTSGQFVPCDRPTAIGDA